jgi:hypothetical protein
MLELFVSAHRLVRVNLTGHVCHLGTIQSGRASSREISIFNREPRASALSIDMPGLSVSHFVFCGHRGTWESLCQRGFVSLPFISCRESWERTSALPSRDHLQDIIVRANELPQVSREAEASYKPNLPGKGY